MVHRRRLGIDLSVGICSLSFSKDVGHGPSLPKAAPGKCMKVPSTTLRFDGSLQGLPESSKAVALEAIGYAAKGYRLMGIHR